MSGETILCEGCGITLRPFMARCPRCGTFRAEASINNVPSASEIRGDVLRPLTEEKSSATVDSDVAVVGVPSTDQDVVSHSAPAHSIESIEIDVTTNLAGANEDAPPKKQNGASVSSATLPFDIQPNQPTTQSQSTPPLRATLSGNHPSTATSLREPFKKTSHLEMAQTSSIADTVLLSPQDEVRRFPLFTRSQLGLMLAGILLLLFGLLIGYLLWSREQNDSIGGLIGGKPDSSTLVTPANAPLLNTAATPLLTVSPTPDDALNLLTGDDAILADVRKTLTAYNPLGAAQYKLEVKDGVITLNGTAAHQPEKDGASNVIKLVGGVTRVINNLTIKADSPSSFANPAAVAQSSTPSLPAAAPNSTVGTTGGENGGSAPNGPPPVTNSTAIEQQRQRDDELLRQRELAVQQREAEVQRFREAEAQRLREEAQRREQQNRAVAEPRSEPVVPKVVATPVPVSSPAAAAGLRSGTVAWSGIVDGIDEIVISGSSASVRHLSGEGVKQASASFSAPIPRANVGVRLVSSNGRGVMQIKQQPQATNGYTTIVQVDDSREAGGKLHQFTLRWNAQ